MPAHMYIPRRQPPSIWDRATAHALEVCTAGYSLSIGLILATRLPTTDFSKPLPITGMHAYVLPFLCFFVIVGGTLALIGLLVPRGNVRQELNAEQYGWLMLFLGYAAYAVALTAAGAVGMLSGATATFLAVGALWRSIALIYIERALDPVDRRKCLRGRRK